MRPKNYGHSKRGYSYVTQKPFSDVAKKCLPALSLSGTLSPAMAAIRAAIEGNESLQQTFAADPQAAMAPLLETCARWKKEAVDLEIEIRRSLLMFAVTYQKKFHEQEQARRAAEQTAMKLPNG